jgi:hypothetical protein
MYTILVVVPMDLKCYFATVHGEKAMVICTPSATFEGSTAVFVTIQLAPFGGANRTLLVLQLVINSRRRGRIATILRRGLIMALVSFIRLVGQV